MIASVRRGDMLRTVEIGLDALVILLIAVTYWWVILLCMIPVVFASLFCDQKFCAFGSFVCWNIFIRYLFECLTKTEGIVLMAVLHEAAIFLINFMMFGYIFVLFLCVKIHNNWIDSLSSSYIISLVPPCEIIDGILIPFFCIHVGVKQSDFCEEMDVFDVPLCEISKTVWKIFPIISIWIFLNVFDNMNGMCVLPCEMNGKKAKHYLSYYSYWNLWDIIRILKNILWKFISFFLV